MSAAERLQAAIDKLERLKVGVVERGTIGIEDARLALRLVIPVQRMLRHDVALLGGIQGDELARVIAAAERAGDLALADAILGGAE